LRQTKRAAKRPEAGRVIISNCDIRTAAYANGHVVELRPLPPCKRNYVASFGEIGYLAGNRPKGVEMLHKARQKELARIDHVLEKHSLKKTPLRRNILLAFSEAKATLSQAQLIEIVSKDMDAVDRVSIYRNLAHLKAAGVLHEVDSNNYVFCSHECEDHAHLLLFCQRCHKHQEVKDHERIDSFLSVLGGFRFFGKEQPVFLRGVCSGCAQ